MSKNKKHIYRGFEIVISQDYDSLSPDKWGSEDIFLVYDHSSFIVEREGFIPREIFDCTKASGLMEYNHYFVLPVYAMIHGDIVLSLSKMAYMYHNYDTSMMGFALGNKDMFASIEEAKLSAESLLKSWNEYLSGDVWEYSTDFDSCSGFYGSEGRKTAMNEAMESIDFHINDSTKSHIAYTKKLIKSNVPIIYRKPYPYGNRKFARVN